MFQDTKSFKTTYIPSQVAERYKEGSLTARSFTRVLIFQPCLLGVYCKLHIAPNFTILAFKKSLIPIGSHEIHVDHRNRTFRFLLCTYKYIKYIQLSIIYLTFTFRAVLLDLIVFCYSNFVHVLGISYFSRRMPFIYER